MYFITVHIHFKTQKTFHAVFKKTKNKNNKPHALMLLVDTVTCTLFFSFLANIPKLFPISPCVFTRSSTSADPLPVIYVLLIYFFLQTYLHLHKSTGLTWTSSNLYRQVFGLILFCFFGGLWFASFFCLFFTPPINTMAWLGKCLK